MIIETKNTNSIPVFIINLEISLQRRQEMVEKMKAFGIAYEFYPAINGFELPAEEIEWIQRSSTMHKDIYETDLGRGEIGAALSHLNMYKRIVKDKIGCAIILEDDIDFDSRLKYIAENKNKTGLLTEKFDIVLLGYCRNDLDYKKPAECSFWGRKKIDGIIGAGIPIYWYWSAIGYLITYSGAQKILKQGDIPKMQADFLTANSPVHGIKLGVLFNPVVWPGELNEMSTIRSSVTTNLQKSPDSNNTKNYPLSNSLRAIRLLKKVYREFRGFFQFLFLKISPFHYSYTHEIDK